MRSFLYIWRNKPVIGCCGTSYALLYHRPCKNARTSANLPKIFFKKFVSRGTIRLKEHVSRETMMGCGVSHVRQAVMVDALHETREGVNSEMFHVKQGAG